MVLLASALLFLAGCATSFVAATPTRTSNGRNSCKSNEFWYDNRSCCLPHGGPPVNRPPPSGVSCPPTNWYWHSGQGCCVPRHEEPPSRPPPQCSSGWGWNKGRQCCEKDKNPRPRPPKPSGFPGHGGGWNGGHGNGNGNGHNHGGNNGGFPNFPGFPKFWKKSRMQPLCPKEKTACPIPGISDEYECLDVSAELESCGGCASTGEGQDCTAIPGAWNVGCENSRCRVYTCSAGFRLSLDGTSCVRL